MKHWSAPPLRLGKIAGAGAFSHGSGSLWFKSHEREPTYSPEWSKVGRSLYRVQDGVNASYASCPNP